MRNATAKALGLAIVILLLQACDVTVVPPVDPGPDPDPTGPPTELVVGLTHGELSADGNSTPEANAPAHEVLGQIPLQSQHLMGWGTLNPEPTKGQRDWSSLDDRIDLIRDMGAEPVLTLCCAPDWMKGGTPGSTDWSKLDVRPSEANIADYASLAAAAAQRYPDIRRFQVWNELKGFYDPATNNWDMAGYMRLYNAVYDAVKAVRPDALVGGPYAPMDIWSSPSIMSHPSTLSGPWGTVDQRSLDVITHFLANAHGADFINVDGRITTRDQGLITDPFTATQFFSDVTDWIQERTTLPVWWSELHTSDGGMGWSLAQQDAVTTVAIGNLAEAQAAVALLWQPQANGLECEGCLWSDPTISIAQPTPLSATAAAWTRCVPAGSVWTGNTSTDPVQLYRSSSEHGTFLVNQTGATLPVLGDGGILELAPYEVRVDPATEDCFR